MNITGKSLINGVWQVDEDVQSFQAFIPAQNTYADTPFYEASEQLVKASAFVAKQAFKKYRTTSEQQRAAFLNAIADQILALGDKLIDVTMQETGLPEQRLQGERMRTVNQLRFFANDLINKPSQVKVEAAQPDRQPLPKPATRLAQIPVGPVAVFGASNFPYAFSVLGGDTASALAAGCSVIVKGHPAHPATSELMAQAMLKAIKSTGMPLGVFSLIQASHPQTSHVLVQQSEVKAVGFTGSFNVAKALQQSIFKRAEAIPLYGELGSVNPQVILPRLMENEGQTLATNFVNSLMMGQGQFCTSPGVWLIPKGSDQFLAKVEQVLAEQASAPLLTPDILASYQKATQTISELNSVSLVAKNTPLKPFHPQAQVLATTAKHFVEELILQEEVFGPFALVIEYHDIDELVWLVEQLSGQLTASIHGVDSEIDENHELTEQLSYKVGRLIFNQMPTGVEVCETMNHGGPFPSSTDVRSTSVGIEAKQRFLRPICYQS